jgi:hypothetical protein
MRRICEINVVRKMVSLSSAVWSAVRKTVEIKVFSDGMGAKLFD